MLVLSRGHGVVSVVRRSAVTWTLARPTPEKIVGGGTVQKSSVCGLAKISPYSGLRRRNIECPSFYLLSRSPVSFCRALLSNAPHVQKDIKTTVGEKEINNLNNHAATGVPTLSPNSTSGSTSVDKHLHQINLNVQRTGRAYISDVLVVFRLMKAAETCSANEALLLLRCCGNLLPDENPEDRTRLAHDIWKFYEQSGLKLDASHYNALLKVYLDNDHDFLPTEFLSQMERNGIEANRVTYQNLVAKYCDLGDIAGATTILEYMKKRSMAVNEKVFRSLISGHCKAGNFDSAKSVMGIMADSGLDVDTETHLAFFVGLIRAGKDWKTEVEPEMKTIVNEENITLSDRDVFHLVTELLAAGQKDAAKDVATNMLPKKSGFFQEMRNALPKMVRLGETELPFEILQEFKVPNLGSEGHKDSGSRDRGLFLLRVMVKNELPVEQVLAYLEKLDHDDPTIIAARILESCLAMRKTDYGGKLRDALKDKFGPSVCAGYMMSTFIRRHAADLHSPEEVIQFMLDMAVIGIFPLSSSISSDLLPKLFQVKDAHRQHHLSPIGVVKQINSAFEGQDLRAPIFWVQLSNCILQYLLNRETKGGFTDAVGFFLNVSVPPRPSMWNASLARSYLATDDMDNLLSFLFCSSKPFIKIRGFTVDEKHRDVDQFDTFKTLSLVHTLSSRYKPDDSSDQVLENVLLELERFHLGIPPEVANLLKSSLDSESVAIRSLVDKLETMFNDEDTLGYWSAEKIQEVLEQRKKLVRNSTRSMTAGSGSQTGVNAVGDGSLESLEKAHKMMLQRDQFNGKLVANLFSTYCLSNKPEEAEALLKATRASGKDFFLMAFEIRDYVKALLKDNSLKAARDAADFVLHEISEREHARVNFSTCIDIALALATHGEHSHVVDFIRSVDKSKAQIPSDGSHLHTSRLLNFYVNNNDGANMKLVYDVLEEKKFLNTNKGSTNLACFIDIHLAAGDLDAAVNAFETLSKEYKKVPAKHKLMEKLIEVEDMERMQRVLDAAIEVIGEENAVHDLTLNFLEMGKSSQAKKLLETPGLRYNYNKTSYILENLLSKGLYDALDDFLRFSRNVFACDRDYMYKFMVGAYRDNPSKIEELWLAMQEEGYVPYDELKRQMATSLQLHGHQVPFEVPSDYVSPKEKKNVAVTSKKPSRSPEAESKMDEGLDKAIKSQDINAVLSEVLKATADGSPLTRTQLANILTFMLADNNVKKDEDYGKNKFELLSVALENVRASPDRILHKDYINKIFSQFDADQLVQLIDKMNNYQVLIHLMRSLGQRYFPTFINKVATLSREDEFIPKASLLHELVNDDTNKVIQVFEAARQSGNPKLIMEAIKTCLLVGQEQLVEKYLNEEDINTKANLFDAFSCGDLRVFGENMTRPVLIFALANGFSKSGVAELYNVIIEQRLNQNGLESAVEALKEALANWVPLEHFKNTILTNVAVETELKSDALKLVKDRRNNRKSERNVHTNNE